MVGTMWPKITGKKVFSVAITFMPCNHAQTHFFLLTLPDKSHFKSYAPVLNLIIFSYNLIRPQNN